MGSTRTAAIFGVGVAVVAGSAVGVWLWLKRRREDELSAMSALSGSTKGLSRSQSAWYSRQPTFALCNNKGMIVKITPVGAAIMELYVPDRKGKKIDVVLGYDDAAQYVASDPCTYFGVVVGRCANRIAKGKMTVEGVEYELYKNNGPHSLHGGALGLHKRKWQAYEFENDTHVGIALTYDSPHLEEGYPGNLFLRVEYSLAKDRNELSCVITGHTDETTPVNVAQHSYFNLAGHNKGDILDHVVQIHGDHYTPVGKDLIPTGEILPVKGTPFDFTTPQAVGSRISEVPGGYDHNYVLFGMGPQARVLAKNGMAATTPKLAATVIEPGSGRAMDILTTAPGLQFYTGNFLDGNVVGKASSAYPKHGGFCMETQGFPNAVNEPAFPTVLLRPEDTYYHEVVYRFYSV